MEPIPPLLPKLPKVYTKMSDGLRKTKHASSPTIPLSTGKKVNKQTKKGKGKMVELEIEKTEDNKETTLAEMFKCGKIPCTRMWNKLLLNIKMKKNPHLEK